MKTIKRNINWNTKCILLITPSIIGLIIFYIIPFFRMLYYSVIDNQFRKNFIGLDNYIKTINNEYFQLALKNSLLLIIICIPVLIILALVISLVLSYGIKKLSRTRSAFILPMVIPSASVIIIWRMIFSGVTVLPIYLLFIWKNIGICIILFTAAFSTINNEIFEAASIDGAGKLHIYCKIIIPMNTPTIIFTVLLSIVNSFKIFKESYLYFSTNYPPDHSYTLQYYMNNNFLKLDYQALATSSVYTTVIIIFIVLICFSLQRRHSR